jgi:hypothetical protein
LTTLCDPAIFANILTYQRLLEFCKVAQEWGKQLGQAVARPLPALNPYETISGDSMVSGEAQWR